MQCNIDRTGRLVRFVIGLALVMAALVLGGLAYAEVIGAWGYIAAVIGLFAGGFCIFEARIGWCAARAMGFRTPV